MANLWINLDFGELDTLLGALETAHGDPTLSPSEQRAVRAVWTRLRENRDKARQAAAEPGPVVAARLALGRAVPVVGREGGHADTPRE